MRANLTPLVLSARGFGPAGWKSVAEVQAEEKRSKRVEDRDSALQWIESRSAALAVQLDLEEGQRVMVHNEVPRSGHIISEWF